jgi:riboflavin kinase / FMN adenylyltransferase
LQTFFINHFSECRTTDIKPCVMALGFFDGIHLGHRKLIENVKRISQQSGLQSAVLTFFPHPKEVLNQVTFNYLISIERKIEILEKIGVDQLYVVRFDKIFARMGPEEFVDKYLIPLEAKQIVAGFDFTYGSKGKGNIHTLEAHGKGAFRVSMVPKVEQFGEKVSSTLIRNLLRTGQVKQIVNYLGDYYQSKGKVTGIYTQGDFTFAEFKVAPYNIMPIDGSYEVVVSFDDRTFHSNCHVYEERDGETFAEIEIPHPIRKVDYSEVIIKWINKRPSKTAEILKYSAI